MEEGERGDLLIRVLQLVGPLLRGRGRRESRDLRIRDQKVGRLFLRVQLIKHRFYLNKTEIANYARPEILEGFMKLWSRKFLKYRCDCRKNATAPTRTATNAVLVIFGGAERAQP